MYDTVQMRLTRNEVDVDFMEYALPYLKDKCSHIREESGVKSVSGYLGGLKFMVRANSIKLSSGSIRKLSHAHNIGAWGRQETKTAIVYLSERLQLPFEKARVSRLDFAGDLEMDIAPENYFSILQHSKGYEATRYPTGVLFKGGSSELVFYDKVVEMKAKNQNIPRHFQSKHILRYEMRLKKRLNRQLKVQDVRASDLYQPQFYDSLLVLWQEKYHQVLKAEAPSLPLALNGSVKGLLESLASVGLSKFGINKVFSTIKTLQEGGQITNKQAHDLRQKLGILIDHSSKSQPSNLLKELDSKVLDLVNQQRTCVFSKDFGY